VAKNIKYKEKKMKYVNRRTAGIFVVFILLISVQWQLYAERIVTLAPALTEIVFELGKGDKIVGVTKYCNYPEEAKQIPRLGGLLDINLELLIEKQPDVIILYPEYYEKLKILENRARLVVVKHADLQDLFTGIRVISRALDVEKKGKTLILTIKQRLDIIRQKAAGKKRVKALLIIGRNPSDLTNMYIIGAGDFLNELIEIAGGVNAYTGDIRYPGISLESVVTMNPDVIIELSAFNEGIKDEEVFGLWKKFSFISAVKNRRIKIIRDSLWLIPGPRVPEIAERMYGFFYGER
jgi:iron complex transport system substrate-binding protein